MDLERLRARPGAKWSRHGGDVLPAWVADMDVEPAPVVRDALQRFLDAGDLGYAERRAGDVLPELFADRMRTRFDWSADPERVVPFTDVVQAIEVTLDLMTEPGDGVALQTPIYPPFLRGLESGGRRLVDDPLRRTDDAWVLDPDQLATTIEREGCRALLVCNPHNPGGRAFRRHELEALAAIAVEHDLVMIVDEIWADLVYEPHRHIPMASLGDDVAARTVTLSSATKSFAMPAVKCAVAHVGPDALLDRLVGQPSHLYGSISQFGVIATEAAWTGGDDWLASALHHLDAQRTRLVDLMAEHLPDVEWVVPEATYLAWLDCRPLDLPGEPAEFFLDEARVALGSGPDFGEHGRGFARLNFATTPAVLDLLVRRMADAVAARRASAA